MWETLESNTAAVNRAAQALPGWLEPFMHGASALGVELFYFALVPVLFWGFSRRGAVHLMVLLIASAYVNTLLKWAFSRPRPYWTQGITGMDAEHSFGIPSGHSQNAVVVWFFLAALLSQHGRRGLYYSIAACIVILISFSRLYLGVHFLQDVLCGWLVGALILLLDRAAAPRLTGQDSKFFWVLLPPVMLALGYLVRGAAVAQWPEYDVLDAGTVLNTSGTLLAVILIAILSPHTLVQKDHMGIGMRLGLIVLTFVVVFGARSGLSFLFKQIEIWPDAFRFFRYTIVGLLGFWFVPWVAARLRAAPEA